MRILYIEDEPKVADIVRKALGEEGFEVQIAGDGEEGYRAARTAEYHMLIVDQRLPSRSGREICELLRAEGHPVPILMLTALNSLSDTVAGLDCGADDYLTKPFALEELVARVRALLRRAEAKSLVLRTDDLTLNLVTHEVVRRGREIHLSAREYKLLEYLMRHPGVVLSRSMIVEHVWSMDFDPESNVVDVYINYIRAKINFDGVRKLISTVRGVGYRLV
jgi:two-component system, OmpR family, copper resistance phosphate regulon response regulator CusR